MRIKTIFESDEFAMKLSTNAKKRANLTHEPKQNYNDLLAAYRSILSTTK